MNFKKGDDSLKKCVLPASQKPTGRQSTETHWEVDQEVYWDVDQSSPTDKANAHRNAIYRDTHCTVYQANHDSIEASFRERNHDVDRMVTKAGFEQLVNTEYRWLPEGTDTLQSTRKHCTKAQVSAGAIELGKYNHP